MSQLFVDDVVSKEGTNSVGFSKGISVSVASTFSGNVSIAGTLTYEDVTNIDVVGLITARNGLKIGAAGIGGTIAANGNTTLAGVVTATTFVGNLTGNPTGSAAGLTGVPGGQITGALAAVDGSALTGMANTANVSTSGLNVVGVSTLTGNVNATGTVAIGGVTASSYYANELVVNTGSDAQSGITIVSETTKQGMIAFADGTSGNARYRGYIDYHHNTDILSLASAGNPGLYINADSHVIPPNDSQHDLGITATRWRNLYADTLYGDGSNLTGIAGGLQEIDLWTITADSNNVEWDDGDNDVLGGGSFGVNIARCTTTQNAMFAKQGTGMSYSSGVFTFPSTGTYEVLANLFFRNSESGAKYMHLFMQLTTNNSSYAKIYKAMQMSGWNDPHPIILGPVQLTITDTTNQKIRFTAKSDSNQMYFKGANDVVESSFSFKKLA